MERIDKIWIFFVCMISLSFVVLTLVISIIFNPANTSNLTEAEEILFNSITVIGALSVFLFSGSVTILVIEMEGS